MYIFQTAWLLFDLIFLVFLCTETSFSLIFSTLLYLSFFIFLAFSPSLFFLLPISLSLCVCVWFSFSLSLSLSVNWMNLNIYNDLLFFLWSKFWFWHLNSVKPNMLQYNIQCSRESNNKFGAWSMTPHYVFLVAKLLYKR